MKMRVSLVSVETVLSLMLVSGVLALAGCEKPPPAHAPEQQASSYFEQVIEPTAAAEETQKKGFVALRATAVQPELSSHQVRTCRFAKSGDSFAEMANKSGTPHRDYYEVRTSTVYDPPKLVQFKLDVSNESPQVLKLDGSVMRVSVDGSDVESKTDFSSGILAPGEKHAYGISMEAWAPSSETKTIRVGVYGVPTEIAADGNVAKRENFEWSFKYTTVEKSKQVTSEVPIVSMSLDEARACD